MGSDEVRHILGMDIFAKEFKPANKLGLYGGHGGSFWFKPAAEDWPMVAVIGSAVHMREVEERDDGYHWIVDPTVDYTDIDFQVYANGWIIWARSHTEMLAVHRPDVVEKIKKVT
jgi:hypothetical protein